MKLRVFSVLLAFTLLIPAARARAEWPALVDSVPSWLQGVSTSRDASGALQLRYSMNHMAFYETYAASLNTDGEPMWGTKKLVPPGSMLATDGAGGVFAAWREGSGPSGNVYLLRISAGGAYHPGPTETGKWTLSATPKVEFDPAVISDGEQGVFAGWNHNGASIRIRRIDSNGVSKPGWPDTGVIVRAIPTSYFLPTLLAPDGAGGLYVAGYGTTGLYVQRMTGNGAVAPGWPADGVNLGFPDPQTSDGLYRFLTLDANSIALVWSEPPTGGLRKLVAVKILSNGTLDPAWPTGGVVVSSNETGSPDVAADGEGGLWATWGLKVTHILADGSRPPLFLSSGEYPFDPSALPSSPKLATGRNGGVVVAWGDARQSRRSIRVRWLDAVGKAEAAEPDTAREVPNTSSSFSVDAIELDESGAAYIAMTTIPNIFQSLIVHRVEPLPFVAAGVPGGGSTGLDLSSPWPNPARESFSIRFALRGDAAATLDLFDVGGRRVRSRVLRGSGTHVETFERLEALDSGLYFVRLKSGSESKIARVALSH